MKPSADIPRDSKAPGAEGATTPFRGPGRVLGLGIIVLVAGLSLPASAEEASAPLRLFFVQFSLGPEWKAGKPPNEQPMFAEHGRNLKRLREAGIINVGLRYGDKGVVIARFASEADARREFESDPGVQAKIFRVDLWEASPFYEGCVERPKK